MHSGIGFFNFHLIYKVVVQCEICEHNGKSSQKRKITIGKTIKGQITSAISIIFNDLLLKWVKLNIFTFVDIKRQLDPVLWLANDIFIKNNTGGFVIIFVILRMADQ